MSSNRITQSGQYGPPSDNQHELSYIENYNDGQAYDNFSFDNSTWPDGSGLGPYDNANHGYQDVGVGTPLSHPNTGSDGSRKTRSGRTTKPMDSPMSSTRSTPAASSPHIAGVRKNRTKKAQGAEVILQAPLSILTKDSETPLRDMEAWANRSIEDRRAEVVKANKIARPMNRFMLYRSAYAERTKKWCDQNNHQIVSKVTGQSWKQLEPKEVKDYYDKLATIERENHQRAFPEYKFSPAKAMPKKKNPKRILDYPESAYHNLSDSEGDPDGEYNPGRRVRQVKQPPRMTHPYADNYSYADPKYQLPDPGRGYGQYQQAMPYAVSQAQMYHTDPYSHAVANGHGQYQLYQQGNGSQQMHDHRMAMNATPASMGSNGALVSMPGGQHHELLQSRGPTPVSSYQQPQHGGNYVDHNGLLLHPDHTNYNLGNELSGLDTNFHEAMNGGFDMSGGQGTAEGTASDEETIKTYWPIIRGVQEEGSDPDAIENMVSRPCMEGFLRFQF
ncbi:hypothetical protein D6C99_01775 [Aureobasidium pullulans]|uniref:HMG box domain-containing protein n=2 Tax=Aureobasidium pullulans TaxID=5580 RepID=A0A074XH73_AURPU|nr:uncharacterized protein M438DRAFT_356450 [Aureobasidium pullulans EXF-150]KEQ83044.1 hypothetical protein M438DRAFT_356450 [Aureobasidium pullulans EXF-150]THW49379.1 hypothetical protein D6D21_02485 [Aureobasidium pullulans]THY59873.1 hypothetical protein D6C99_01775 [Aureobasidium pullulans]